MKHQLESDWSDKTEAVEMDSHALSLSNNLTYVGMKPGSLGFVETMSTLEQWHSYTNNNMKDSNQLRSLTKALSQVPCH